MGTKDFNPLDKFIAKMRLSQVLPFVENDAEILDFGCGHQAFLLRSISDKIKRGVGVDYDVEDQQLNEKITLVKDRMANKLPFNDQEFDTVFMLAVLEHIPLDEVDSLFREFNRILKPGGRVVLTTPTPKGKVLLEFLAYRLKIISKAEIDDHKKYYVEQDIVEIGNTTNFKIEKYKNFQFGMNSICALRKI